ncbi:3-isopropylmalate dehydratase small subunit [Pseudonocardia kunmingensis]|uniref:3-isopropylmalate dehydratase small subunit n=1 Tax=Pseudonocardia kunmingensis TaxID=630975 RepID=A0A543DPJ7_9PSEU|nr:3-isopropylmalate dehydratase small subunit [Pseudonocardia kunmingensis]TQM11261.1 3-isopropylmalate/(R)-2-methylmalate dehydratase small subunit [Pseudonocardia kunmingensis]
MEPFTVLTAVAAPLPWSDVNTDDIFPGPGVTPVRHWPSAREVLSDRHKMGPNAFAAHRYAEDGTPNPEFVLNRPPYDTAGILIARENFGCGSSREMAVWALVGIGLRCIIAPSFGDIFAGNCVKNGVLPVRLGHDVVERLLTTAAERPDGRFTVDLQECTVTAPDDARHAFAIGAYQRDALLNGLDEIAATLSRLPTIDTHEAAYLARRPWLGGGS